MEKINKTKLIIKILLALLVILWGLVFAIGSNVNLDYLEETVHNSSDKRFDLRIDEHPIEYNNKNWLIYYMILKNFEWKDWIDYSVFKKELNEFNVFLENNNISDEKISLISALIMKESNFFHKYEILEKKAPKKTRYFYDYNNVYNKSIDFSKTIGTKIKIQRHNEQIEAAKELGYHSNDYGLNEGHYITSFAGATTVIQSYPLYIKNFIYREGNEILLEALKKYWTDDIKFYILYLSRKLDDFQINQTVLEKSYKYLITQKQEYKDSYKNIKNFLETYNGGSIRNADTKVYALKVMEYWLNLIEFKDYTLFQRMVGFDNISNSNYDKFNKQKGIITGRNLGFGYHYLQKWKYYFSNYIPIAVTRWYTADHNWYDLSYFYKWFKEKRAFYKNANILIKPPNGLECHIGNWISFGNLAVCTDNNWYIETFGHQKYNNNYGTNFKKELKDIKEDRLNKINTDLHIISTVDKYKRYNKNSSIYLNAKKAWKDLVNKGYQWFGYKEIKKWDYLYMGSSGTSSGAHIHWQINKIIPYVNKENKKTFRILYLNSIFFDEILDLRVR